MHAHQRGLRVMLEQGGWAESAHEVAWVKAVARCAHAMCGCTHAHIHAHTPTCSTAPQACLPPATSGAMHTQMHTDTHRHTHTRAHTNAHTDTQTHTDTRTHTRARTQTHTDTQRHTNAHTDTFIHRYMRARTHTHMHTQTHTNHAREVSSGARHAGHHEVIILRTQARRSQCPHHGRHVAWLHERQHRLRVCGRHGRELGAACLPAAARLRGAQPSCHSEVGWATRNPWDQVLRNNTDQNNR